MQDTPTFLDPNSEMIALASYANTKNLLITAIEIKGPVDESLLKPSVMGALEEFPQLRSCMKEMRTGGRHHLYWDPRPDMEFPVDLSHLKDFEDSVPVLDAVLNHLAPRLDRDWDLFRELPGEVHFVKISEDHHVAVTATHHSAFDAATASEFGRQCVLKYMELLTGVKDDFPGLQTHALSTSRKRTVEIRRRTWEDIIYSGRLALTPLIWKPALPQGSGMPDDPRQFHIKRVLSSVETARIAMSSLRKGGAFIDLLAASGNLAIERWNQRRNAETGRITTAVTMNIRGRYESLDHSNNVSALFFESDSADRNDPDQLVRSLSTARIRQFRRQMDFKQYENTARLITCASPLPFKMRRQVVHQIIQRHRYSIAITLLGIVWPVLKNGKPTFDSYPTRVGDTVISEIHGTGYKHLTNTPLVLIVYSFLKRLNLVMATSASLFTREEAEAFMDLFMEVLREGAARMSVSSRSRG